MCDFKQVIVVRTDINMSKGKLAVQVAHASVTCAFKAYSDRRDWFEKWWMSGQKKIVLKAVDEKHLLELYEKARILDLPVDIIRDAGLTELTPGTLTAICIGPAPSDLIDKVTGGLKTL